MTDILTKKHKLNIAIINRNISTSLILSLYLFIDLLRFFKIIPLMMGNILYVLLGATSIIYSVFKNGIAKQMPIFCFIYLYIFFGGLGILFNGNMDVQELIWPFAFMGLTILLLNFEISYNVAKGMYYFVIAFFIINIIFAGGVDNLNTASSRNSIGVMLLLYFSMFSIASYTHSKKMTLFPVLLGFVVTVMAIGRSGILTFLLLTLLLLFFEFDDSRYIIRNPIKIILKISIVAIILLIAYKLFEGYFDKMISNFLSRGLESTRLNMWSDYLVKTFTSVKYFLFGTPISGTDILEKFNQNLHNSFFMLHAKYGLVPLMTVVILIINAFIYFIKSKNMLYFITLLTLLFRMQFDYTNFNAQLDIVLFYFIFFPYKRKDHSRSIKSI